VKDRVFEVRAELFRRRAALDRAVGEIDGTVPSGPTSGR
jgi:hypothetical protein